MDSDNSSLDILIRTLADTNGIDNVEKSLQRLKDSANDVSKPYEKFTETAEGGLRRLLPGHRELASAVRLLGHEFGELGGLVHYLFSPWTIALGAVLVLTKAVHEANQRLKESFDAVKGSIGDMAEAIRGTREEQIKSDKAFHESVEMLQKDTKEKLSALQTEKKAVEEVMEARRQLALSTAKTPEQKAMVEAQYSGQKIGVESVYAQREIDAKQSQLESLESARKNSLAKAAQLAPGMSKEGVDTQLSAIPGEKDALEKQAKALKEAAEKNRPSRLSWLTSGMMWPVDAYLHQMGQPGYKDTYKANEGAYENQMATATFMEKGARTLGGREEALTGAQTAFSESASLQKSIDDLTSEIKTLAGNAAVTRIAAVQSRHIMGAAELNKGAFSSDAIISGGVSSLAAIGPSGTALTATKAQTDSLAELVTLFGVLGANGQKVVLLAREQLAHGRSVQSEIEQLRQQLANLRNMGSG